MKKIVTITINKTTFNIDEDAYNLLSSYLDDLKHHFDNKDNNEKEIIEDVEARISELLSKKIILSVKEVITIHDVNEIIKTLGKIEDYDNINEEEYNAGNNSGNNKSRSLFRDIDKSVLGGVAAGLGSYFSLDPLWIRIAFVIFLFINGFGLILYIILWIVVPPAKTTTQKLQMKGDPINISNIEKTISKETQRIKEKAHNYKNSEDFQRLRDNLNNILYSLGDLITFLFKFIVKIIGIIILLGGLVLFFAFIFGISLNLKHFYEGNFTMNNIIAYINSIDLFHLCLLFIIGIPVMGILIAIFKFLFGIKSKNMFLKRFGFTLWILTFILFIILLFHQNLRIPVSVSYTNTVSTKVPVKKTLHLKINPVFYEKLEYYNIFNRQIIHDPSNSKYLGVPELYIYRSDSDSIEFKFLKKFHFGIIHDNGQANKIDYNYTYNDSIISLDQYFYYNENIVWKLPELEIILKIPQNSQIMISKEACNLINEFESEEFLLKSELEGKKLYMNTSGLKALN